MITLQHFPVIAVMGLFFGAFLIEIFGNRFKAARNVLSIVFTLGALVLMAFLVKPVLVDGEIISYWMGGWEPVKGYAIGIGYEADALGMFFALLVTVTTFLATLYSLRYMEKDEHLGHYYTLTLMLEASVLGLVLTGDIFNMFIMVEIMTFASVALTAFRNNKKGALEAAFKYLVIGTIGSGFTLFGVALIYMQCHTLNMAQISSIFAGGGLTPTTTLALALIFIGFGVKSYIVPFHTPAADAYEAAPTSISMVFAGMVNKAGVYGMIRILFVVFGAMDVEALRILVVVFGAVTMFVGVTMALAQHDFKRLLAYHSISQIGYVITAAGLATSLGMTGGLFHALNHTLFKGLLFLCAGAVFYAAGTTDLDRLGGLSKKMPKTTACFLIGALSISGIPPFNGFASKWMIYQATYEKGVESGNFFYVIITIVAVVVSVMTLASFIKVTQAVFFGQTSDVCKNAKEVPLLMRIPMWVLSVLCLLSGVLYPVLYDYILRPASNAVFNITNYIDKMMGAGYAASANVADVELEPAVLSYWNPILWLILFVIILAAVCIVILTGKNARGAVLENRTHEPDGKYATFFGGEKSEHSHVAGSDLFWGFKKNFKGYFKLMNNMHNGNLNDYSIWTVAAAAVAIIVIFIFVH